VKPAQCCSQITPLVYVTASTTSNSAGDRHGVVHAKQIPVAEARLIVDVCMALALYVIEQHQLSTGSAKPS